MLLKAFHDQIYFKAQMGLDKLFEEGKAVLESVDWKRKKRGMIFDTEERALNET